MTDVTPPKTRGRPKKTDAAPAEPVRRKRAVAVGSVVAPLLEPTLAKKGVALARIIPHWRAICPLLAEVSAPESVKGDVLTVAVASDAVKQELLYMTPHLIETINMLMGYAAIAKVRAVTQHDVGQHRARVTPSLHPAQEARDKAAALCQHVADDALKAALTALGATIMQTKGKTKT